jgi:hypothetical protein
MTKRAALQKIFIKQSRALRLEGGFQITCWRYVDK